MKMANVQNSAMGLFAREFGTLKNNKSKPYSLRAGVGLTATEIKGKPLLGRFVASRIIRQKLHPIIVFQNVNQTERTPCQDI